MKDKIEQSYEVEPYSDDSFCFVERLRIGDGRVLKNFSPEQMYSKQTKSKDYESTKN